MMPETGSFGEKLLAAIGYAGKHGRKSRLHGVVDDAIKRHGDTPEAQATIMCAIDDDPALMVEILDELKFRRPIVNTFIKKRVSALRHQGVVIRMPSTDGDRAGHVEDATHARDARPEQQNAAQAASGGQSAPDTQLRPAPAPQQDSAESAGRAVQPAIDTQREHDRTAPQQNSGNHAAEDGAGQTRHDTQAKIARPSTPTQTDRAAMIQARNKQAGRVLSYASLVRGKPYGDLTKPDLEDEVRRADHRGQFARRVLATAEFPDDQTPLKRAMSEKDAANLWAQAWEAVTDA